MLKHKHKDHDKKRQWHFQQDDESSDHQWDESSDHQCDESSDHQCEDDKDHHRHPEGCVKDVLKAILHAQKKAKKHRERDTSCCKESIRELLEEKKKAKKNTIPFILYSSDLKPFKATGVTECSTHTKKRKLACLSSFIFKIKDLDGDCAVLELLTFKHDKKSSSDSHHKSDRNDSCSPCCQIDHQDVDDLVGTGICITVDLSCFCAISCLPPVCL